MTPLAELDIADEGPLVVARIRGEVDMSNTEELGEQLRAAVPNDARCLAVELTATRHLDSAGVRLIFGLQRRLRERNQELTLVVDGGPVARVLSLTRADEAVTVHPTLADARRACASG